MFKDLIVDFKDEQEGLSILWELIERNSNLQKDLIDQFFEDNKKIDNEYNESFNYLRSKLEEIQKNR